MWWARFKSEYDVSEKTRKLAIQAFNVIITGVILWYVITYRNFLSYGLASALAMFYIGWLIDKIKENPVKQ